MYKLRILLIWIVLVSTIGIFHVSASNNVPHDNELISRSKRAIYYTHDNRLTLPPGTILVVEPSLILPFIRKAQPGYGSDMVINIPLSIKFDGLGLTSEENPWGIWPDFSDYVDDLFRKKREAWEPMNGVNWAGGDREMVYQVAEDYLTYLGMKGKPCLLRAICELFETPLLSHGLFGEFLHLFSSASNSIGAAERLADYLEAEKLGRKQKSCSKYYKGCSKSLFTQNAQKMKDSTNIDKKHHNETKSRSKRLIYYTHENRLALPPSTTAGVVIQLGLPLVRNAPPGLQSHTTIQKTFQIIFDDLGYTSEENPWGLWPDFGIGRKKRQAWEPMDGVNWAGGDREMVFQVIEDYLNFHGMNGKPCLLRAICECFETPLLKHGLLGESLQLIFSASNSIGAAERLADYLEAEELGKKHKSCSKYYARCGTSLFTHNGQKMKDTKHIERTVHNFQKMFKEDPQQCCRAKLEELNELMECGKF